MGPSADHSVPGEWVILRAPLEAMHELPRSGSVHLHAAPAHLKRLVVGRWLTNLPLEGQLARVVDSKAPTINPASPPARSGGVATIPGSAADDMGIHAGSMADRVGIDRRLDHDVDRDRR